MKRIALVFGILPAVILLLAACHQEAAPPPLPAPLASTPPPPAPNRYLGNEACRECHAAEFQAHHASRHARTLRLMDRQSLGDQSPPTGRIANTPFQLTREGDGFGFGPMGKPMIPLQLAFGSGKSGMAFTVVVGSDKLAEAHMSYFPPRKQWYITPGQENLAEGMPGNIMQGESARQCVSCHVVTLPEFTLMPEKKFLGVGCESCHGPGEAHVAAMRTGDTAHGAMDHLGSLGGTKINELCGRCHRTEQAVQAKNLPAGHTDLFQAYGLAQSRCFRESGDRLTCVTCHNPHTSVSAEEKTYTTACLRCHAASGAGHVARLVQAKVCPVNPTEKCVTCHMPKRAEPVFPGSPRRVADHFIRVHRQDAGAPPTGAKP